MTLFSTLGQGGAFLGFFLVGVLFGLTLDLTDGVALLLKGGAVRFVADVFAFAVCALLAAVGLSFVERFRVYFLVAIILGAVIERRSLSILLANLLAFVYNKARKVKNAFARRKKQDEKQHGISTDA